jgi:hypothetical protein
MIHLPESPYLKFIVACIAALGVIGAAVADRTVTSEEIVAIVAAISGAGAVFGVKNTP